MAKNARLALATEARDQRVDLNSSLTDQITAALDEGATVEQAVVSAAVAPRVVVSSTRAMPASTKGKASAYPWLALEVGQSFFVAGGKVESFWSMCAERNKANPDRKFKACRFTEDGVAGVGVWRIK